MHVLCHRYPLSVEKEHKKEYVQLFALFAFTLPFGCKAFMYICVCVCELTEYDL